MHELFQAGIIAIPLKHKEESPLALQPNFFVIENQFGMFTAPIPSMETGELEDTLCSQIVYKVVYREILPAKYGKEGQYIERQLQTPENQATPIGFLTLLHNLQSVIDNAAIINAVFGLFTFRGILDGLQMEVDVDKIQQYLDSLVFEEVPPVVEEIPEEEHEE